MLSKMSSAVGMNSGNEGDAEFLSYKERTSHSTDAQDSLNGEKIFCCESSSSRCPILYPKTINDSFHTHV